MVLRLEGYHSYVRNPDSTYLLHLMFNSQVLRAKFKFHIQANFLSGGNWNSHFRHIEMQRVDKYITLNKTVCSKSGSSDYFC